MTVSIVGTNDVHGYVFPANGRGGLAVLGGYLNNLRAARAADQGAVVVLDAGDTFQGGIESNLSEGGLVVDAYNALGYTAAAIGNHEFDFGPVDTADVADLPDPRGALKALAARAQYPVLAANLVDESTGRPVAWTNVRPSTIVTIGPHGGGIRVGIIGAMTADALRLTLSVNVQGLRTAPLAGVIAEEASRLRAQGADLVLLTIHAGGRCAQFDDSNDLSSCDRASEVFRLVHDLPKGTLDAIVAGHTHAALAHIVDGVPIIESFSGGRAFGRMDLTIDRSSRRAVGVRLFQPQDLCAALTADRSGCAEADAAGALPVEYEHRRVVADTHIANAMAPELARVRTRQARPLHVTVDSPVRRNPEVGAPLGQLFAEAMRESTPGADLAVNNNGIGGLRADLPRGMLTFGRLYDVFPFDNRVVQLTLSGTELEQVFAEEVGRARPGALAISGIHIRTDCGGDALQVRLARSNGQAIAPNERLTIVTTDMLASGAVFSSVVPPSRVVVPQAAPLVRDIVATWLERRGGHLSEDHFVDSIARDHSRRRWDEGLVNCPPPLAYGSGELRRGVATTASVTSISSREGSQPTRTRCRGSGLALFAAELS